MLIKCPVFRRLCSWASLLSTSFKAANLFCHLTSDVLFGPSFKVLSQALISLHTNRGSEGRGLEEQEELQGGTERSRKELNREKRYQA